MERRRRRCQEKDSVALLLSLTPDARSVALAKVASRLESIELSHLAETRDTDEVFVSPPLRRVTFESR
jgi:hypothetical protein